MRFVRDADPNGVTVGWLTSGGGAETKLRITSELLAAIADVLATEPYSEPGEFLGAFLPGDRHQHELTHARLTRYAFVNTAPVRLTEAM